ncbi:hypothetical protein [Paraburkholderia sacchari]|nr:hypothetical protein [Paraburkholderia sacchari]
MRKPRAGPAAARVRQMPIVARSAAARLMHVKFGGTALPSGAR